jgi:hypothetical protein
LLVGWASIQQAKLVGKAPEETSQQWTQSIGIDRLPKC